ncbi:MAG: hypothetical protein ACP5RV_12035 [Thiomonas sp.]
MSPPLIRLIAAAGLFALWGALVFLGKADAAGLVLGIQAALLGLGVFHTAQAVPSKSQEKSE